VTDAGPLEKVHAPSNGMANARLVVDRLFTNGEGPLLRFQSQDFYRFDGRCWPELEATELRAGLYQAFEHASYVDVGKDGAESKPFRPNRNKVGELVEALRAVTLLPPTIAAPAWLDDGNLPATEFVPVANGLLHLRTRELVPHTPRYWCHHAAAVAYDPDAELPERWFAFLDQLWGDDDESKELLGELFGYLLSTDTTQQKVAMLIGPKRAGKGVIGRVLTGLLGAYNVAGPTLASLGTNFGLAPLIGKPVAIISDARLARADAQVVVERLLSISGEDALTIDRKHRESWTGRLPTRFVVITNELPTFADTSGDSPPASSSSTSPAASTAAKTQPSPTGSSPNWAASSPGQSTASTDSTTAATSNNPHPAPPPLDSKTSPPPWAHSSATDAPPDPNTTSPSPTSSTPGNSGATTKDAAAPATSKPSAATSAPSSPDSPTPNNETTSATATATTKDSP
jgi:hypothetical protein